MSNFKIIKDFNAVNLNKIAFKQPLKLSENYSIIPLKYQNNKLLLQTPKMNIPFGMSYFSDKKFLKISFLNYDNDVQIQNFSTFLSNFENHIKQFKIFNNLKFISPIYKQQPYPDLLNMKIYYDKNQEILSVFTDQKEMTSINNIEKNIYCKSIILIPNIWFNNSSFGYDIYVLQIKIYPKTIYLNKYSFLDDDEYNNTDINKTKILDDQSLEESNNKIKLKDHPTYSQYFKLLNYGVPINQIKFKMENDNLDPTIIDKSPDYIFPLDYDKSNKVKEKINNKINNLDSLLQQRLLLKQVENKVSEPKIKKNISKFSFNLNINLQDILHRINNLRKTEINLIEN